MSRSKSRCQGNPESFLGSPCHPEWNEGSPAGQLTTLFNWRAANFDWEVPRSARDDNHRVGACIKSTAIMLPRKVRNAIATPARMAFRVGSRSFALWRKGDAFIKSTGAALDSAGFPLSSSSSCAAPLITSLAILPNCRANASVAELKMAGGAPALQLTSHPRPRIVRLSWQSS